MATKLVSLEEMPEILSAQNISDHLHLSRRRIYELFQTLPSAGGIPCIVIGGSKRVKKETYIRWIDSLEGNRQEVR